MTIDQVSPAAAFDRSPELEGPSALSSEPIPVALVPYTLDGSNVNLAPASSATPGQVINWRIANRVAGFDVSLAGDVPAGLALVNASDVQDTRLTGTIPAAQKVYKIILRQSNAGVTVLDTPFYLLVSDIAYAPFLDNTGTLGFSTTANAAMAISNHSAKRPFSISRGVTDTDIMRFALSDGEESWNNSTVNRRSEVKFEVALAFNTVQWVGGFYRWKDFNLPDFMSGKNHITLLQVHTNLEASETGKAPIIEVLLCRSGGKPVLRIDQRTGPDQINGLTNTITTYGSIPVPSAENVFHNLRMEFRVDHTGNGFLYLFHDGQNLLTDGPVALGYNDTSGPYVKAGLYCNKSGGTWTGPIKPGSPMATVEWKGLRIGTGDQTALIYENPNPYIAANASQGVLLEGFETANGWNVTNGAVSVSPAMRTSEANALRIEGLGLDADPVIAVKSLGMHSQRDMGVVAVSVGWEDLPHSTGLDVAMSIGDTFYTSPIGLNRIVASNGSFSRHEGQRWLAFRPTNNTSPTAIPATGLQTLKLRLASTPTGAPFDTRFYVDTFAVNVKSPGKFVFTFDDMNVSIYTVAYPILKAAGFVGVIYFYPEGLGATGKLTLAMIKEMMANGWKCGIGSYADHGATSTYYANPAAYVADLLRIKQWMADNGLINGSFNGAAFSNDGNEHHGCWSGSTTNIRAKHDAVGYTGAPWIYQNFSITAGSINWTADAAATGGVAPVAVGMRVRKPGVPKNTTIATLAGDQLSGTLSQAAITTSTTRAAIEDIAQVFYPGKLPTAVKSAGGMKTMRGTASGNTLSSMFTAFGFGDTDMMMTGQGFSANANQTVGKNSNYVNQIVDYRTTIIFYFHKILTGATGIDCETSILQDLVTKCKTKSDAGQAVNHTLGSLYAMDGQATPPVS